MCVPLCCRQVSDQIQNETLNCCNLYTRAVHNECFTNDNNDIDVHTSVSTQKQSDLKLDLLHLRHHQGTEAVVGGVSTKVTKLAECGETA